ncbi:calcium-binding protein [Niveispirillum sp. KHB5.9]|uniref:calcium-binding protein n=1 Tax=Niveispirillum sp. KHB5.9 TaxID=3400269 RepID=UPI003A83608F
MSTGSGQALGETLQLGTFTATSLRTLEVGPSSSGSATIVDLSSSSGSGSGGVTNVVVSDNTQVLFISGTASGSVSAVFGGTGTSFVVGSAGTEFVDLSKSTQNATVVAGVGNDSVLGGGGNDTVQLGDSGVANGGGGADTIIGGLGVATLGGGGGADSIVASSGGGALIGEAGNDTMVGGAGKDVFIFSNLGDQDVVAGFDPAQDTIGLANYGQIVAAGWSLNDVISRATVSGNSTIINMPDGSTITVSGVTGININWFTVK